MLNPMVVDGQVHGGITQGIGGALFEELVYDEDGQFLSSTLMDYLYPSTTEVPHIEVSGTSRRRRRRRKAASRAWRSRERSLRGRCIRAAAIDLCQNGFPTIVPRECVGDRARAPHEANLFDIHSKYADVISLEETLGYVAAVRERPGRRAGTAA